MYPLRGKRVNSKTIKITGQKTRIILHQPVQKNNRTRCLISMGPHPPWFSTGVIQIGLLPSGRQVFRAPEPRTANCVIFALSPEIIRNRHSECHLIWIVGTPSLFFKTFSPGRKVINQFFKIRTVTILHVGSRISHSKTRRFFKGELVQ